MRIYADTSFLVELLYPGARQHASTRKFYLSQPNAEWITSDWSQFETINAIRQLCMQNPGIKTELAESLRRLFKHWHRHSNFTHADTNSAEAISEAQETSAAHGTKLRMRSADALHVALLEQIEHDLFVTRDKDQFALAMKRAFNAQLLP